MKKLGRFLALVLIVALMSTLLVSCNKSKDDGIIKVGYMPYYASIPLLVIEEEGLDEKYGFEMEKIQFTGGAPMAEAVGAGEWEVGQIGAGGVAVVTSHGGYLYGDVQYEMDGAYALARPGSKIAEAGTLAGYPDVVGSAETIKGSTCLAVMGNISQYMMIDYLNKFGLTTNDVEVLYMDTTTMKTNFLNGVGDLSFWGDPTAAMELAAEGYPRVGGLKQQGVSQQDIHVISPEFYENNKEDAIAFMNAFLDAAELLNADLDYEFKMAKKFYTEVGGRTGVADEAILKECKLNSYIDRNNIDKNTTGGWITGLIECYVDVELYTEDDLKTLKENTVADIADACK